MNKTLIAHLSLFTSMLIYAAGFSIIKEVTPAHVGPQGFVLMRVLGATPLLWLTGLLRPEKIEKADFKKLVMLSFFGVIINQSLFIKGMSLTSPISGAIIMITSPLLVLIIGNIILKEKITLMRLGGILLGLFGAAMLVITNTKSGSREDNPLGDLFVFINALSWGAYLVLVKPLMKKYHTVTILKWIFLFSIVILAPLGYRDVSAVHYNEITPMLIFDICFVVFGVTFFAYILNTHALAVLSPSIVSAYIYLQPVLAAAIALSLGKDELHWQKVVSAILIFAGVALASKQNSVVRTQNSDR